MSFDDEDEFDSRPPTPEESAQTVTVSMELSKEELLSAVAEKLAARAWSAQEYGRSDSLQTRATNMATKAIAKRVEQLAESLIVEQVTAALDDVLTNGFPVTDGYGNEKSRRTIKQFALSYLENKDGYARSSKLEEITKGFVDKALTELKPEVDALKAKVRAAYNASADVRIKKAIEEAIGV